MSSVREKFWIPGGRNLARQTVHKCIKCFRCSPKLTQRIASSLPFGITGVDYAGPILIRNRTGRGSQKIKSYVCIFVFFYCKLVSDLTTGSFIMCLRRFVRPRGLNTHIYSNNGRNFIGAKSELTEIFDFINVNQKAIIHAASHRGITWHFISVSPLGGLL